jgi:hypothetical protein
MTDNDKDRPNGRYAVQRADGRFLTPHGLQWCAALDDAQRCFLDEAKALQGWLDTIGIKTRIVDISAAFQATASKCAE